MKAVIVPKQGAPAELSTEMPTPEPGDDQILVKSIYTAINPVDQFMAEWGILVEGWPLVPGCDAAGIVVEAGRSAHNPLGGVFKEGDQVFGCTRLGSTGYSPWQEYFLMDAQVTIAKPGNVTLAQAATVGVGVLTACLGVFDGLRVPLVDVEKLPAEGKNEWVLVFGGASAVGKFAVQVLKVCGYKVVTTCSAKSFDLLKSLGADATVDYKKSDSEMIDEVKSIIGGKLDLVFDAVSVNNRLASAIFAAIPSTSTDRLYTTTNDWDPLPDASLGFTSNPILLGPIGRPGAIELNKRLNKFIPVIYKLLESGRLKVGDYSVEGEGIEGILKAWEVQKSGKMGSTKVVVKVADAEGAT